MSIIIKGIDKPLNCNECPCWNEEYTRCQTKGNWDKGDVYYALPKWCPIEEVPAADVAPVRRGKWIDTYGDSWVCSVCGAESYVDEDWRRSDDRAYQMNYCHYCGAKME